MEEDSSSSNIIPTVDVPERVESSDVHQRGEEEEEEANGRPQLAKTKRITKKKKTKSKNEKEHKKKKPEKTQKQAVKLMVVDQKTSAEEGEETEEEKEKEKALAIDHKTSEEEKQVEEEEIDSEVEALDVALRESLISALRASATNDNNDDDDDDVDQKKNKREEALLEWVCPSCTYINQPAFLACEMCLETRTDLKEGGFEEEEAEGVEGGNEDEMEQTRRRFLFGMVSDPEKEFRPKETSGEFSCPVCMEDYDYENDREHLVRLPVCGHEYCDQCLLSYFQHTMTINNANELCCPDPTCNTSICHPPEFLEWLLPADKHQQYLRIVHLKEMKNNPSIKWCPKPGCDTYINTSYGQTRIKCTTCGTEFCFQCNEAHEASVTCAKYEKTQDRKHKGHRKNTMWKKMHTKNCPHCRVSIEKNKGCSHMHCTNCNMYFCWRCGADLTTGQAHCLKYKAGGIALGAVLAPPVFVLLLPAIVIVGPPAGLLVGSMFLYDKQKRNAYNRKMRRRTTRGT